MVLNRKTIVSSLILGFLCPFQGIDGEWRGVFFFKNYSLIPGFIYSHVPFMAIKRQKIKTRECITGFCIVWKLAAMVNCFEYYFYSSLPAQRPFSRKTTFRFEFNGTESVRLWSVNTWLSLILPRRLLINYERYKKWKRGRSKKLVLNIESPWLSLH